MAHAAAHGWHFRCRPFDDAYLIREAIHLRVFSERVEARIIQAIQLQSVALLIATAAAGADSEQLRDRSFRLAEHTRQIFRVLAPWAELDEDQMATSSSEEALQRWEQAFGRQTDPQVAEELKRMEGLYRDRTVVKPYTPWGSR